MAFQQNAFQHNAFQVGIGGAAVSATPLRTLMGVGLGVRMLAGAQLKESMTRRKLFKTVVAIMLPWKGK